MPRILPILLVIILLGLAVWGVVYVVSDKQDQQTLTFIEEADTLISAFQEYRKFVGSFPSGTHAEIADALSGQGKEDRKVLLLANNLKNRNQRGEMQDPWGTPLQIFFTHDAVLIRSAGPNRQFDDALVAETDDLVRTDAN